MIVTFNPFAGSTADAYGAYANFIRCVQAVATANAGTTSLTVNPMLANTGAMDMAKNCIISIDANDEGGGWSTSTASNVPQPSVAWTGVNAPSGGVYKLELYRASGKSSSPYYRFVIDGLRGVLAKTGSNGGGLSWTNITPQVQFTFGSNSANDATDTSHLPVAGVYAYNGTQTKGYTVNTLHTGPTSTTFSVPSFMTHPSHNPLTNYKISVTQNYIILWEENPGNSYAGGYANQMNVNPNVPANYYRMDYSYGSIFYAGLRETASWEDARNDNPPWVIAHWQHLKPDRLSDTNYNSYTGCPSRSELAASIVTLNNTGTAAAAPGIWYSNSSFANISDPVTSAGAIGFGSAIQYSTGGSLDYTGCLQSGGLGPACGLNGLFTLRSGIHTGTTSFYPYHRNNLRYMPAVDPNTGSLVPPAIPIVISRNVSDSWTPGGAIRGMYKSLSATYSTMQLYFSNGQTFTVNGETYFPLVFGEDMYLMRKA